MSSVHINLFFFFFSSRRRHTRFDCDWSSDVCSSDLHSNRICASEILPDKSFIHNGNARGCPCVSIIEVAPGKQRNRSEEHTSELQSQSNLVCRLLLEKKKYSTC